MCQYSQFVPSKNYIEKPDWLWKLGNPTSRGHDSACYVAGNVPLMLEKQKFSPWNFPARFTPLRESGSATNQARPSQRKPAQRAQCEQEETPVQPCPYRWHHRGIPRLLPRVWESQTWTRGLQVGGSVLKPSCNMDVEFYSCVTSINFVDWKKHTIWEIKARPSRKDPCWRR